MNRQDRQKLGILVVLLAVLGLTLVLGYRMARPPTAATVQSSGLQTAASEPNSTDARIRLDAIEKPESLDRVDTLGDRNVFRYRERPAAPRPAVPAPPSTPSSQPSAVETSPSFSGPTVKPAAPPPPIPFKYHGYAVVTAPEGRLTAFLTDEASRPYNVTAGEILMGRFRIVRITDSAVEVEDMQFSRRQTLPVQK